MHSGRGYASQASELQPQEDGRAPFGDGGQDNEPQRPRLYTHGPCRGQASDLILDCSAWRSAPALGPERRKLLAAALEKVRENGFVVLERLLPEAMVVGLEEAFAKHYDHGELPEGFVAAPLRAGRVEIVPPCASPWVDDLLVKNELILGVVAGYLCNHMADGRTEEEQKDAWLRWVCEGSDVDWFATSQPKAGPASRAPGLYQVTVVEAPPHAPAQRRHRDIILPGPRAQLIAQVALTQFSAVNGPVAFVPGSHVMKTPGYEVVAVPPRGSVVLYDSFLEHRAIENHTARRRSALYITFSMHGIHTGYAPDHFGIEAAEHTEAFRRLLEPALRASAAEAASRAEVEAGR